MVRMIKFPWEQARFEIVTQPLKSSPFNGISNHKFYEACEGILLSLVKEIKPFAFVMTKGRQKLTSMNISRHSQNPLKENRVKKSCSSSHIDVYFFRWFMVATFTWRDALTFTRIYRRFRFPSASLEALKSSNTINLKEI